MIPREFKYIIVGEIFPRICSLGETHIDLRKFDTEKVTSAGFAKLDFDPQNDSFTVHCYGESVGLKLKSNPSKDAMLLEMLFSEPF
jgi:hypothetical protein